MSVCLFVLGTQGTIGREWTPVNTCINSTGKFRRGGTVFSLPGELINGEHLASITLLLCPLTQSSQVTRPQLHSTWIFRKGRAILNLTWAANQVINTF